MLVEPGIEQAPWEDQARSDASLYLKQIEYLFDRSRFYREKLERAGFATHGAVGGLDAIEGAPLTEKDELQALALAGRADRRASDRLERRDRAHVFDQRHHRNAKLYSADRRRSRGLGAHVRSFLRRLGADAWRAHRLDL